ncbi:MAG: hypothetical protein PVI79_11860, partial [Gammaproteobacteria bacterium]
SQWTFRKLSKNLAIQVTVLSENLRVGAERGPVRFHPGTIPAHPSNFSKLEVHPARAMQVRMYSDRSRCSENTNRLSLIMDRSSVMAAFPYFDSK